MSNDNTTGYAIEYPDITLHAICRDPSAFAKPCLFAQLVPGVAADEDEAMADPAATGGNGSATLDLARADELRLVPSDGGAALEGLYEAMCACAELHPDASA